MENKEKEEKSKLQVSLQNVDVGATSNNADILAEGRCYKLNEVNSMKKKLTASENTNIQLTETGGGVKLALNAGMYELLRDSADKYLMSLEGETTCKKTQVTDKTGHQVETKYKVSYGKCGHYTLNMYHTRSSCLVNGKNTAQFLQNDLPRIFTAIETKISSENCSMEDFNANVRDMILQYFNARDTPEMNETSKTLQIHEMEPETYPNSPLLQISEKEVINRHTSLCKNVNRSDGFTQTDESGNAEKYTDQSTQTPENNMAGILRSVHAEISEMKDLLSSHILFTNNKFSQLKDEIVSIKNLSSTHHASTDRTIDELSEKQTVIKTEVQRVHDSIQRRFQGIFNQLKTLHEKSITGLSMVKPIVIDDSTSDNDTQRCIPQAVKNTNFQKTPTRAVHLQHEKQQSPHPDVILNNVKHNINELLHTRTTENGPKSPAPLKERTLVIGDSILKGIQRPGLDRLVDCYTISGAIITDIDDNLRNMDLRQYENVVIFDGGNDVSAGKWPDAYRAELMKITTNLQRQHCRVYLCTVSPRQQVDVSIFNSKVKEICDETGADLIDVYQSFVYGDGSRVRHYFFPDGVHLNGYGSRALVTTINRQINIVKRKGKSCSSNWNQTTYAGTSSERRIRTGNQGNMVQRDSEGKPMMPSVGRRSVRWTYGRNAVHSTGSVWTSSN